MTTNQIAYYDAETRRMQALESARHNQADERIRGETNAINRYSATEQANYWQRSNEIADYNAKVQEQHYINLDSNAIRSTDESIRHNKATEQENVRHNQATEDENFRHNWANEDFGWANVGAQYQQVALGQLELAEAVRHNTVAETNQRYQAKMQHHDTMMELRESGRHNVSVEDETQRHNVRSESITSAANWFNYLVGDKRNDISQQANEINQQRADIAQQEANIHQQQADSQKWRNRFQNVTDVINSVANIGKLFTSGNKRQTQE